MSQKHFLRGESKNADFFVETHIFFFLKQFFFCITPYSPLPFSSQSADSRVLCDNRKREVGCRVNGSITQREKKK